MGTFPVLTLTVSVVLAVTKNYVRLIPNLAKLLS